MIGLFDSGFGGLTVLRSILSKMPDLDVVYLGDAARNPYGNHSQENVIRFTRQGVEFLFSQGANLVILACNTASANALRTLQEEMIRKPGLKGKNILGVVVPIAEFVHESHVKKVALIGTRATVQSRAYEKELERLDPQIQVLSKACPLLVPLIEEGWAHTMETRRILKSYLRGLKAQNPEILVPACTHYPILQKEMIRIMGKKTKVLDTGAIVADKLVDYLGRHPEYSMSEHGLRRFFTTDDPEKFRELGSQFLGMQIENVEHANIDTSA